MDDILQFLRAGKNGPAIDAGRATGKEVEQSISICESSDRDDCQCGLRLRLPLAFDSATSLKTFSRQLVCIASGTSAAIVPRSSCVERTIDEKRPALIRVRAF